MIEIVEGNLLDYDIDMIVQQVNTRGVMGGGLSGQIMSIYPEVPMMYTKYLKKQRKKITSHDDLLGEVLYVDTYDARIVCNIFGQTDVRTAQDDTATYTQEDALIRGITAVRDKARELHLTVGIPTYIGCGLGGGDWRSVKEKIEQVFEGSGVDVRFFHYR